MADANGMGCVRPGCLNPKVPGLPVCEAHLITEWSRQRALLRRMWARLEQGFLLTNMLGRDLADRLRSEFEGEDPHDVDSGF